MSSNRVRIPRKLPHFQKIHKHKKLLVNTVASSMRTERFGYTIYLIAREEGLLSMHRWEIIRRFFIRILKKDSRVSSSLSMSLPLTKKAARARMGKGSGEVNTWVYPVKAGTILFFVTIHQESLFPVLKTKCANLLRKLPFRCSLEKHTIMQNFSSVVLRVPGGLYTFSTKASFAYLKGVSGYRFWKNKRSRKMRQYTDVKLRQSMKWIFLRNHSSIYLTYK